MEPPLDPPPLRRGLAEELTREDALRGIVQGWMECVGPTTASTLAARLGLEERQVEAALLALEASGTVLRGRFTPGALSDTWEWCERRLLARIHHLTIGRLRREIEPVSVADFIRFLLRWQHVHPGAQLHGRGGLLEVIGQLQGLELPAPAWERDILPARISRYDPSILESLCLAGLVTWGRLAVRMPTSEVEDQLPAQARGPWPTRRTGPTRAAPLAFMQRDDLPWLLAALPAAAEDSDGLSAITRDVANVLGRHGASFLSDLVRQTGYLPLQVEEALWELVACGLVTGDGIAGLRTLLTPDVKRRPSRHGMGGRRNGGAPARLLPVGRWSLLRPGWMLHASPSPLMGAGSGGDEGRKGVEPARGSPHPGPLPAGEGTGRWAMGEGRGEGDRRDEAMARQLLRRYGVMLRELLAREHHAPSWRTLLRIYRRLEARGEVRGGRFVGGVVGEQFALPEAVEALRAVRRQRHGPERVVVAVADPLNVVGILTPGPRISPFAQQVILYQDGVPMDIGPLGAVRSRLQGLVL